MSSRPAPAPAAAAVAPAADAVDTVDSVDAVATVGSVDAPAPAPAPAAAAAAVDAVTAVASGGSVDVLDRSGVLSAVVVARRAADRHEAELLALAAHFADLHPVPPGGERAGYGDPALRFSDGHGGDLGAERYAPLAGDGTPAVAEFAPEELAAALGVSGHAAKTLIGQALELRHRLPRLWALVHGGRLQAWKARTIATDTIALGPAAAGFVDRHLAVVAARNRIPGPGPLARLIHEALLRCDPEVAAAREQTALDRRGVWASHREATATTTMTIIADTPDALAFDHTLSQVATTLATLGDPDPLDTRRARAIGILADPQHTLNLLTGPGHSPATHQPGQPGQPGHQGGHRGASQPAHGAGRGVAAVLYLHLHADPTGTLDTVGTAERYGALTTDLIASWLETTTQVTIRPVLHTTSSRATSHGYASATAPAAGYTPPPLMREQVILRDPTCVFPGCTHPARTCDLDHITPYTPGLDQPTGPDQPDQQPGPDRPDHRGETHPDNLAPLCRRHHRIKTHGRWHYTRDPDGAYTWTTPTGTTHTVDRHGTRHPQPAPTG